MATHGQTIGYVRVSTIDQNLSRQHEAIGQVDRTFSDQVSGGSRRDRHGLTECLRYVRDGDTVRVASIDRLARSLVDLQQLVDEITAKGATVHFVKENLTFTRDTTEPTSTLMLQILGSFAQFERAIIRERQAEGIRIAKAAGKYRGRPLTLTEQQVRQARDRVDAGVPKARVAADLGVSRSTLYRALTQGPATVEVTAARWSGGWELQLDGEPVTQCESLDDAPQEIRDYLDTVNPDVDHASWSVLVRETPHDIPAAAN